MAATLEDSAWSTIVSGISTAIAICPLYLSRTSMFSSFVVLLVISLLWVQFFTLVVLPLLLGLIGPQHTLGKLDHYIVSSAGVGKRFPLRAHPIIMAMPHVHMFFFYFLSVTFCSRNNTKRFLPITNTIGVTPRASPAAQEGRDPADCKLNYCILYKPQLSL